MSDNFMPITINVLHDQALIEHFEEGIGRRVFILTPAFPFVFIGKIIDVIEDHVFIDVETTSISQLENRIWNIHIHQIQTFFIERDNGPSIPELKDEIY
ncbi:hypothetical protein J416_07032 [Gracilibacillus halophilus YIM-C55.5]|uniref:DUF2642 domain-containing protein n=1 Tax=Gracilibacillus halophilus YIM-C55.5 TaxID=1308866 RepID=N4WVR6_9BACI|nr:hypothetical protein [Gracilibacillus halophilus]ENH97176.1 hypothetical protein J416_07032 [Gracilibacillus halophilus YIM-C55.5]